MKMLKVVVLGVLVLAIAVPLAGAQVGTWDSSISIINLGGASATVEVTFFDAIGASPTVTCLRGTPGPSCQLTNPFSLAAGAKEEIYLPAVSQLPNGRYSAVVSADQPIAAIGAMTGVDVNKYFTGGYTGEGAGATSMYLPGIQWNFYAWDSHLSIQNLTGSPQDITVQFYTEGTNTVCNTQGPHSTPAYSSWHLDTGALSLSACDTGTDGFNLSLIHI